MTCIIDTKSKRRLSAKLAAGIAISALLVFGTFVASSSAAERRAEVQHGGYHHGYRGHDYRGGGYYPAPPPVVYGSPYYASPYGYAPPPVVYGPGIGVTIGIQ
jgi:hypothetical protein